MKPISVQEIVEATNGKLIAGRSEDTVTVITTDSRVIPENALFVPIVGERMDGHDFLMKAVQAGAKCVLTSRASVDGLYDESGAEESAGNCAIVLVQDTITALQKVGKLHRSKLTLPCIGITGSVGKTTTREMVSAALASQKSVFKTDKNYNNKIGVPLTLSEMTDDYDFGVLELGLNVRDELGTISELTNIETCMITNIGVAHIEFYGTKDEICKEKFTVTKGFRKENPAPKMMFLNGDDPYLLKYKDLTGFPYTTYAVSNQEADYAAQNIRYVNDKTAFTLMKKGKAILEVTLSVLGLHNVLNAVGALAVCDYYGLDLEKAQEGLSKFSGFAHRLQRFEKDGALYIDDTYNASPQSMKAGIDVLESLVYGDNEGDKLLVLGDMFELGENGPAYHREVGEYAAKKNFTKMLLAGELSKNIEDAYRENGGTREVVRFETAEELEAELRKTLKPGDVAYFKASHGMHFSDMVDRLLGK